MMLWEPLVRVESEVKCLRDTDEHRKVCGPLVFGCSLYLPILGGMRLEKSAAFSTRASRTTRLVLRMTIGSHPNQTVRGSPKTLVYSIAFLYRRFSVKWSRKKWRWKSSSFVVFENPNFEFQASRREIKRYQASYIISLVDFWNMNGRSRIR